MSFSFLKHSFRRFLLLGCLLLFVTAIVVLSTPWAIRDYRVHNKIVIANIFTFDPRTASREVKDNKKEDIHSVTNIKKEYKCDINQSYPTEGERELIKKGFNPNNRTKNELWAIKRDVYPLSTYWGRKWQSLRELWRVYMLGGIYTPYPVCNFKSWSIERNLASIVCYGTLLPFTLIGMLSLVNKRRKDVWFFFIPVLFHTIFYTLSWGSSRFRVPIDFFLIILGGYGIVFVYDFFVVKLFKRTKTT